MSKTTNTLIQMILGAGKRFMVFAFSLGVVLAGVPPAVIAQTLPLEEPRPLAALSTVTVPEPPNLADFVRDKLAAIRLGKALFWDMQVGSDGIQACASCHFQAGADNRSKNQLSPGLLTGDTLFGNDPLREAEDYPDFGPNCRLTAEDFPLRKLQDPEDRNSAVVTDTNDVVSSMGVFNTDFTGLRTSSARDLGVTVADPVFNVAGVNTRKVPPRNSPPVINAVFNFANFWDGRANFFFNGVNPFGPLDRQTGIFVNSNGILEERILRIPMASLASQAVGPPLSDFEMSFRARTWPQVGKKLLGLRPLNKQKAHPQDSVLGQFSRARVVGGRLSGLNGLNTTYADMIRAAFQPEYWDSELIIQFVISDVFAQQASQNDPRNAMLAPGGVIVAPRPSRPLAEDEFTQMEANFSFFFGLSVQLYEATLVSDDTPLDRFLRGDTTALSPRQQEGLEIFRNQGRCINCHSGAELTNASAGNAQVDPDAPGFARGLVEGMRMASGELKSYDDGFYNIGLRPTAEDISRGGTAPFMNPFTGELFPLSFAKLAQLKQQGLLPEDVAAFVPVGADFSVTADGAMKTPSLRNVELTGPYFHNGSAATLRQVVDFYARGGNFRELNIGDLDLDIDNIGHLLGSPERKNALVDFLLALTDERVRQEIAPFDHPQLFLPHGQKGDQNSISGSATVGSNGFQNNEEFFELPAVGASGRPASGLPALKPFLELNQFDPGASALVTANNDSATAVFGSPVTINVTSNDTSVGGDIDPQSVRIISVARNGTAFNNGNGTVTYTPNPAFIGTDTFTYTVDNTLGAVSNEAAVTITVVAGDLETISVSQAIYGSIGRRWVVSGRDSRPIPGLTITVTLERTGQVIGRVNVFATGSWILTVRNSPVIPQAGDTISLESSTGAVLGSMPVIVR